MLCYQNQNQNKNQNQNQNQNQIKKTTNKKQQKQQKQKQTNNKQKQKNKLKLIIPKLPELRSLLNNLKDSVLNDIDKSNQGHKYKLLLGMLSYYYIIK